MVVICPVIGALAPSVSEQGSFSSKESEAK